MKASQKIKTVLVDDNAEFLSSLEDHLSVFPEIEVCGTATQYHQAKELLVKANPDLVFLDVVMPHKNGFELLNEVRQAGIEFSAIFHTSYDQHMIQSLRDSALDYILKPIRPEDLKNAIERFKSMKLPNHSYFSTSRILQNSRFPEIVAIPTLIGIQFIDVSRILMFRSTKANVLDKPSWEVVLRDNTLIRLAGGVSAEKISKLIASFRFIQINQSCILNLIYVNIVEYKTRHCILLPPFEKIPLTVSRAYLNKLKEKFDVL